MRRVLAVLLVAATACGGGSDLVAGGTHPELRLSERFWTYPLGTWMEPPEFPRWRRWLPFFGEDERGYRTVVLPWRRGNLVAAYRRCFDPDCIEVGVHEGFAAPASGELPEG